MKIKILSIALICGILLQSCATILTGSGSKVRVPNGTPRDAKIYINGNLAGTTPEGVKVSKNALRDGQTITIKADGYKAQDVIIRRKVQVGYVVLDILFGVVPLALDFATGAIYRPSPDRVHYDLEK